MVNRLNKTFMFICMALTFVFAGCTNLIDDLKDKTIPVTSVSITGNDSVIAGQTITLTATVLPENATDKTVTWSSTHEEIATVENGVVTGVSAGTAVIIATSGDKSAYAVVNVKPDFIEVNSISLSATNISVLLGGEPKTLTATVLPENATNKTVTWSSFDSTVASVNENGVVTAVSTGHTIIKASAGGNNAYCAVTVTTNVIEVNSISLSAQNTSILTGETKNLIATINPENATDTTVTWSSSDETVATVNSNGVVTAVSAGNATITATSGNGKTASCSVTVTLTEFFGFEIIPGSDLGITKSGNTLTADEGYKSYTWYVNTVKQNGVTTNVFDYDAVLPEDGIYNITVEAKKNGKIYSASMNVNYEASFVRNPVFSVASGEVKSKTSVAIKTATKGASIYYTTDGTNPTTTSTLYEGPVTISKSVTIKAIAVKEGLTPSQIVSAEYTVSVNPYITFKSDDPFTLSVAVKGWDGQIDYSKDASVWTEDWDGTGAIEAEENADGCHYIYLRGKNNTTFATVDEYDDTVFSTFKFNNDATEIECNGNIMTLLDYEEPDEAVMGDICFGYLFAGASALTKAPELPATSLSAACYAFMFMGCTSLTKAPELSATTLSNDCYMGLFAMCTSLEKAPELPAETLTKNCYAYMFYECISLAEAPVLPATTLAENCYEEMFYGCTSLVNAPVLPATTLADSCYETMFSDCTSLVTAPALPATTLAESCYDSMFYGCTNLVTAPALPATTLAEYCYDHMFTDCTSLETAPALPAMELSKYCYSFMFLNCTSLTTAPALPATTLSDYCYMQMFSGCSSLTESAVLPAISLANYCYYYMFYNCTSLTKIGKIGNDHAFVSSDLKSSCFNYMFYKCSSLKVKCEDSVSDNTFLTIQFDYSYSDYAFYMFTGTSGEVTNSPIANKYCSWY